MNTDYHKLLQVLVKNKTTFKVEKSLRHFTVHFKGVAVVFGFPGNLINIVR